MKKENEDRRENRNKRQLLYQSVIELIEEGMDLHAMKVIDITTRAGIGKGTAYEYFKSKEELVVQALVHDIERQVEELENALKAQADFHGQVVAALEFLEKNQCRKRSATWFFRLIGGSYEVAEELRREFGIFSEQKAVPFSRILRLLLEQADREGKIGFGLGQEFAKLAVVSQFITYFLYLNRRKPEKGAGQEAVREFLYRNLCAALSS